MHRTYVRRRLTLLLTALAVVVGVSGQVAAALGASGHVAPASSGTYVVRRGDTLWSIASSIAPQRDPREVVLELQRHDRGDPGMLVPGEVLLIPPPG